MKKDTQINNRKSKFEIYIRSPIRISEETIQTIVNKLDEKIKAQEAAKLSSQQAPEVGKRLTDLLSSFANIGMLIFTGFLFWQTKEYFKIGNEPFLQINNPAMAYPSPWFVAHEPSSLLNLRTMRMNLWNTP